MSTPLYSKDGVYTSPRPPIYLPHDPEISMVPFLFRNFSSIAQTTALIDSETGQILTFSDLKKQVSKLSNALLNLKISKNDVVFIFSQNSILFPVSFLAVVGIGAIATTANPQYTAGEVTKQADDSNPKLIITTHELYHKNMHLNLPCIILSPKTSVHIKVKPNVPIWYFSDLIESSDSSELLPLPSVLQTDVAALLYSSGTTGTSKGVVLTHRNFIATSLMVTSDQEVYRDPKNVFLCFLPLFHIFGLAVVLYAQLQRGNAVVVMAKYEMEKMLMAIEKHKVAHMFVAPPVVIELAKRPEVVKKYDVSSLKEIGSGAAPLGKEVMEDCDKIFAEAVIYQGYGMTETCGIISLENTKIGSHHSGSTGVLVPGVESQIIDINSMKSLPPFHKGEIWVRGQNMMQGYLKNPKATTETIDEQGWVHTGDLGYFDDAGRLYVVDRLKELIKCKGYQVAPAELEELLLTHPEITDAAVIPWEDPKAGEVPIAYVVRSSNSSLSQEHVKRFISEQVAQFKRLQRVIFIDNIPKSASGKILRRELRQKNLSKL